jgi:peptidoglycan/LPS O-acetylase OafA/YrhL
MSGMVKASGGPTDTPEYAQSLPLPPLARPAPDPDSAPVHAANRAGRKNRLAVLDGLRFLAALSVVLFHFVGQTPGSMQFVWGRPYNQVFSERAHSAFAFGRLGVDLFFLISGFVICMSAWGRSPREFFISRISRLYPMYWIAIVLTTVVLFLADSPFGRPDPQTVIANLTMLQTPLGVDNLDSVYWTLWPELCFYLLFAAVVWRGLSYQRVVIFCGLWTVAAVLCPSADLPLLTLLINPTSAPYFIAGMAFYLMYRYRPTPILWGIVAMSYLIGLHYLLTPTGGRNNWHTWHPWRGWLVLLTTFFFFAIAAIALGWTRRIQWRWLSTAGTLTFPLYLIHDSIGVTVVSHLGDNVNPWLLVTCLTAGLVLLAYVLQRFAERPLADMARRALRSSSFSLRTPQPRR